MEKHRQVQSKDRLSPADINFLKLQPSIIVATNRGGPTQQAIAEVVNFYNPTLTHRTQLNEYVRLARFKIKPQPPLNRKRRVYRPKDGPKIIDNLITMFNADNERAGNMRDIGITIEGLTMAKAASAAIFPQEERVKSPTTRL